MKRISYVLLGTLALEILIISLISTISISISLTITSIIMLALLISSLYKENNKIDIFLLLTLLSMIVFMPFLLKTNIFCFLNDQYVQYDYMSEEWSRLLTNFVKNGSMPFYSFNSFLGDNYFASKLYYVTGDILYPIIMLFDDVNEGYLFETIMMVVVSGFFVYIFLEKFGIKNRKITVVASVLYAFSGTSAFFLSEYFWHRFFAVFPLLLYGVEVYRQSRNTLVFSISVCLCFLMSYYLMFSATLFLIPYYIFTNYYHSEITNIFEIIKSSIKLIISYLFGLLLSGILLIPAVINIINNSRVGSGVDMNLFFPLKVYLGYLYNFVIAPLSIGTILQNNFIPSDNYHLWGYSTYINAIIAPIVFSYLFVGKSNHRNIVVRNFVIFMTIISLIPITNSIMHGFSGASFRWVFMTAFVYLIGFAIWFDNPLDVNTYKKGFIVFVIVFIVSTIVAIVTNNMTIDINNTQLMNACLSLCLLSVYLILLKKQKLNQVLLICCIETIAMFGLFSYIANSEYKYYEDSLDRNAIAYINDQDEDKFYRNYIDYHNLKPFVENLNLNQSLHYGYKSSTSYDTTYESNLNEFLEMNEINSHMIEITNPEVLRMLGTRYYYVLDDSELPTNFDFTYITNNNNFKIYKLNNNRPIAFTYSSFTNDKKHIVDNNLWNSTMYVDDELYKTTKDINGNENYNFKLTEYYDDNNLKGTITVDKKRLLFFSIPYNEGWRIKDNGENIKIYKVQGGFIGIVLEPGEHYLELNFVPQGFKLGCIATTIGILGILILKVIEMKRAKKKEHF